MNNLSYKQIQALFQEYKKTGSEEAFKKLYMATSRPQYFIAYNYINNTHLAQEAVQNMYISFINHVNTIENDMGVVEWMNRTTINMCHKLIDKEKLNSKVDIENYEDNFVDTKQNPEDSYKRNDDIETLNKALNKLEPNLKQLIIYRFVDNLKIKEISAITKLSTATVNRYIAKATMKLKKHMENIEKKMYGFFITPFMFRLFDSVMKAEFSNKQMASAYASIAKSAAFASSGIAVGAAGAKLATGAAKKAGMSATNVIGGTAAVAATAGIVVAVVSPNYTITTLKDNWVLSQVISISSDNLDQINNVKCYQNDELIGELTSDNDFTIKIENNGDYKLIIEDVNGDTKEESIEITNIDFEVPTIDVERLDDVYKATINDTKSGINYSSISVVDQDDRPIEFSISDNVITCPNSNPITKITVYDNLGNGKRMTLSNE